MRRSLVVLLAALFTLFHVLDAPAQPQLPTHFNDHLVTGGLAHPVGMAFLPDGRLLFVELRSAKIRMIVRDTLATTDPVGTIDSVRTALEEDGLMEIAVDPDWPARPYLYVVYSAPDGWIRISRVTATGDLSDSTSGNLTVDPASRYDLIRDIPDSFYSHNGGSLLFGTDGMLYAGLGDDAWQCAAQDTIHLSGQMIRMNVSNLPPGPGIASKWELAPADNPFATHRNPNARLVWAIGLRNPWRIDLDPVTGAMFIGDVGWNTEEEISVADGPGINFGWSWYEGTLPYQIITNECGLPIPPTMRDPIYRYDRVGTTGAACVIGGSVYRPTACPTCNFPGEYDGDYFFSDFYNGFLRRLKNKGGTWSLAPPVPGQPSATDWGSGFFEVTDFAMGPDGALWYVRLTTDFQDGTGEIHRVFYEPPSVGVADRRPDGVTFAPPVPSPARGEARFSFTLPREARVELSLFDALGRRVRVVQRATHTAPGTHALLWDGRDGNGREVSAGLYIARLVVDGLSLERRLPLVR